MAKVYSDIPADIVSYLRRINFDAIEISQREQKLRELYSLTSKHVDKRKNHNITKIEIDIPHEAAEFINSFDFAGVGRIKREIAKPIILAFLKTNNLLK